MRDLYRMSNNSSLYREKVWLLTAEKLGAVGGNMALWWVKRLNVEKKAGVAGNVLLFNIWGKRVQACLASAGVSIYSDLEVFLKTSSGHFLVSRKAHKTCMRGSMEIDPFSSMALVLEISEGLSKYVMIALGRMNLPEALRGTFTELFVSKL